MIGATLPSPLAYALPSPLLTFQGWPILRHILRCGLVVIVNIKTSAAKLINILPVSDDTISSVQMLGNVNQEILSSHLWLWRHHSFWHHKQSPLWTLFNNLGPADSTVQLLIGKVIVTEHDAKNVLVTNRSRLLSNCKKSLQAIKVTVVDILLGYELARVQVLLQYGAFGSNAATKLVHHGGKKSIFCDERVEKSIVTSFSGYVLATSRYTEHTPPARFRAGQDLTKTSHIDANGQLAS
jgi:hypothetical protein